MAEISVLIPVYNVEDYLERCLDSVIGQTFSDLEILCIDDGSTDRSGKILDRYAEQDSRLRVIHKENSGYGNSMNLVLSLASGTYIGIVESDDYIEPDMYEKLHEAITYNQLDFVKTDYYQMWECEDGTEQNHYHVLTDNIAFYDRTLVPNQEPESYFLEKFTWNALYRKAFLLENKICYHETPGASYQDNGFWFQTFYHAKRVMFLRQAFYHYKQDNPNSSINSDKKIYAMKEEYDFIRDFLVKQKVTEKIFYKICFYFRMDGCLYTLSMLADQYKRQLAETVKAECNIYEKLGEADFSWFSEDKMETIRQIRENPETYSRGQVRQNEEIRKKVKGYPQIIIYGAGVYGRNVYERIRRIVDVSCRICMAVTDLGGETQYYHSCTVKELKEFTEWKENSLVILSVKGGTPVQEEMLEMLKKLQFKNVLYCQEILS